MNTAPVAVNDTINVIEDVPFTFDPTLNDTDADGDTLTISDLAVDQGFLGYPFIDFDGLVTYEYRGFGPLGPDATDTFGYTISDGNGGTSSATVTVNITPVNDAPEFRGIAQQNFYEGDRIIFISPDDEEDRQEDITVAFTGPDAALFELSTDFNFVQFIDAPDYENPQDENGDNIYEFTATLTDTGGLSATQNIEITVLDIGEYTTTNGDDDIVGSSNIDHIDLLGGNDRFFGLGAFDSVRGGDGNDTVFGGSDRDYLEGNAGDDLLFGDEGNDGLEGNEGADKLFGGSGSDYVHGDQGNDILQGEQGADYLYGGDDDDRLYGGPDEDNLFGEAGDDVLFGDDGDDYLLDRYGNNRLSGGNGEDYLYAGAVNDPSTVNTLRGGAEDDYLTTFGGRARLFGDAGRDYLISDGSQNDLLVGGTGGDYLYVFDGNNRLLGQSGDDELRGGYGNDQLNGGSDHDTIWAGEGNDRLIGGSGNDSLSGEAGNDTLFGGDGHDTLDGGADDDRLDAGAGNNAVTTGTGNDLVIVDHFDLAVTTVTDFDFAEDTLIIRAFDGNNQVRIDSEAELYALNLAGMTITDDGTGTTLDFALVDGTSHSFILETVTQFDLG